MERAMGIEPSSGLRHHVELFEDISASESKKVQNESSTFSDSEQMFVVPSVVFTRRD